MRLCFVWFCLSLVCACASAPLSKAPTPPPPQEPKRTPTPTPPEPQNTPLSSLRIPAFEPRALSSLGFTPIQPSPKHSRPLVSIHAFASSHDLRTPIASTSIQQTITNRHRSPQEAVYRISLPTLSASGRVAMDVFGTMTEGELVPEHRAQSIYDGIVRKRKDPAITRFLSPSAMQTRMFPVAPNERKRIVHEYDTVMPTVQGAYLYTFQLPNPRESLTHTSIPSITTRLQLPPNTQLAVSSHPNATPSNPLPSTSEHTAHAFSLLAPAPQTPTLWTTSTPSATYFLLDLPYSALSLPQPKPTRPPQHTIVLIDTSASIGSKALQAARSTVETFAQHHNAPVHLITGGLIPNVCNMPKTSPSHDALRTCLNRLHPRGASNLGALLRAAIKRADSLKAPSNILLFSDGHAPLSDLLPDTLTNTITRPLVASRATLHTVPLTARPNLTALARLAAAGGGELHTQPLRSTDLLKTLQNLPTRPPVLFNLSHPSTLNEVSILQATHTLSPQGRMTILGRSRGARLPKAASVTVQAHTGNPSAARAHAVPFPKTSTPHPAVERLWATHKARALMRQGAPSAELHALAVRHGVQLPSMSFLVLENQAAFDQYRIPRIQHQRRLGKAVRLPTRASLDVPHKVEQRARGRRLPRVRASPIRVSGYIDKSAIQRVMRKHTRQISACFQERALFHPRLSGKIRVNFTIRQDGLVSDLSTNTQLLDDVWLDWCVRSALSVAVFPRTRGGGSVHITYPFQFEPQMGSNMPTQTPEQILNNPKLWSPARMTFTLDRLLAEGKTATAEDAYQRFSKHRANLVSDPTMTMLPILASTQRIAAHWSDRLNSAMRAHLQTQNPRRAVLFGLVQDTVQNHGWPKLPNTLQHIPIPSHELLAIAQLAFTKDLSTTQRLLARAVQDPQVSYALVARVFAHRPALQDASSELFVDALVRHPHPETLTHDDLNALVRFSNRHNRAKDTARVFRVWCGSKDRDMEACIKWFSALDGAPQADSTLRSLRVALARDLYTMRSERPEDVRTHVRLARVLMNLGQRDEALEIVSELLEFDPYSAQRRRDVVARLVGFGAVDAACDILDDTLRHNPKHPEMLGVLYTFLDRNAASEGVLRACVQRVLSNTPADARAVTTVVVRLEPAVDARAVHVGSRGMVEALRSEGRGLHIVRLDRGLREFSLRFEGLFAATRVVRGDVWIYDHTQQREVRVVPFTASPVGEGVYTASVRSL